AILSDSRSTISSVNNKTITNDTILQILETHAKLVQCGKKVTLIWIPSHIGITGNEKADQAAKEAPTDPCLDTYTSLHFEDLINYSKKKLMTEHPNIQQTINDRTGGYF
ncbi:hypothetical protein WH47_06896, partial [Habropoda laboriosa]